MVRAIKRLTFSFHQTPATLKKASKNPDDNPLVYPLERKRQQAPFLRGIRTAPWTRIIIEQVGLPIESLAGQLRLFRKIFQGDDIKLKCMMNVIGQSRIGPAVTITTPRPVSLFQAMLTTVEESELANVALVNVDDVIASKISLGQTVLEHLDTERQSRVIGVSLDHTELFGEVEIIGREPDRISRTFIEGAYELGLIRPRISRPRLSDTVIPYGRNLPNGCAITGLMPEEQGLAAQLAGLSSPQQALEWAANFVQPGGEYIITEPELPGRPTSLAAALLHNLKSGKLTQTNLRAVMISFVQSSSQRLIQVVDRVLRLAPVMGIDKRQVSILKAI